MKIIIDKTIKGCYNSSTNAYRRALPGEVLPAKQRRDIMKKTLYEFYNYFPFLKEVIKRDFKKKYYKSFLGVAWSMLSPLLIMIVMTIG